MGTLIGTMLSKFAAPTDIKMQDLIGECDELLKSLQRKVKYGEQLTVDVKTAENEYQKLKTDKIPQINGAVDPNAWNSKPDEEKIIVYEELEALSDKLGGLNRRDLRIGRIVFGVISGVLAVTVLLYLWLHGDRPKGQGTAGRGTEIPADQIIKVQTDISQLQTLIKKYQTDPASREAFKTTYDSMKMALLPFTHLLAFDALDSLGKLEGEVKVQAVQQESLDRLGRIMSAQLKSARGQYFWSGDSKKWFEIAFWSVWGAIVGILFYLAGELAAGIFDRHEIPMIITEIIITPFVVITIFLLFNFTGITAFIPEESSIYTTLGVSFILGFAIRRTVGLLDNIKRRLLPEPQKEEK